MIFIIIIWKLLILNNDCLAKKYLQTIKLMKLDITSLVFLVLTKHILGKYQYELD